MRQKRSKEIKWHKLDNTAKIFPVVASKNLSNVYRIAVVLKEKIDPVLLQEALERILPWFDIFRVRLRRGVFWYYFEDNKKKPVVEEEITYPCRYIEPYSSNMYLFRVTYYGKRINLEVFHAITDGAGAVNFLKELTYQYLRLAHKDKMKQMDDEPTGDCSFNMEDSYLKNYKKTDAKGYRTKSAIQLKGELLPPAVTGIIHGYIDISGLKTACKKKNVSITQYLTAVLIWAIYKEYLNEGTSPKDIRINIPVNLRNFFDSTTTKNFFAVLFAGLSVKEKHYTFEEILNEVTEQFKPQLTKENLERLISYNVSNEKNILVRPVPLFLKNIAVKLIYSNSVRAFTSTISNLGYIQVLPEYEDYIVRFQVMLGVSKKQTVKCGVCSYGKELVFTFSSVLMDTSLQKAFYRRLVSDGIDVTIESNGVYYEDL